MKEHTESVKNLPRIDKFNGTIIDIETCYKSGKPNSKQWELETYTTQKVICLGYLNKEKIKIYCCEDKNEYKELTKKINNGILTLPKPYYAFQHYFEKYVLKHNCNVDIQFYGDLNITSYESKEAAVKSLNIHNYDDPFFGKGGKCMDAFLKGDYDSIIKHNRSCLIKEYEILIRRGFRPVNGNFVENTIKRI